MNDSTISIVIPTYRREKVLLDTVSYLLDLQHKPSEILVLDQTQQHEIGTADALKALDAQKKIKWIWLPRPSITHAMNVGIREASANIILFLDDDIIPCPDLISAHLAAHECGFHIVAGQVLQPGEEPLPENDGRTFCFHSTKRQVTTELMAGNFSISRELAISLGGFDENFVQVAYRFETEFAERATAAGIEILFEPAASIRHLKESAGGTRSFGSHLNTIRPGHAVGAYYYFLRSKSIQRRLAKILARPFREIRTRYHLRHPWWIPSKLLGELLGFIWALFLATGSPKLMSPEQRYTHPL